MPVFAAVLLRHGVMQKRLCLDAADMAAAFDHIHEVYRPGRRDGCVITQTKRAEFSFDDDAAVFRLDPKASASQ